VSFEKKYGFHYAWVVLAAACMLNIVARADQNSFGVFIDPLVDKFGWKRGDISFAYSLAFIVGLPAVVLMGWLGDRVGTRLLMIVSSVMIGGGTILLGMIGELWHFYVIYGFLVGAMGHAAFSVLLPVIMTRWFATRMGVAIGIYWAAQGIGPVIFAPLFRWLLDSKGWNQTFFVIGIGLFCILFVFSLFIYASPAAFGCKAYGEAEDKPAADGKPVKEAPSMTLREVFRGRTIWLLIGIHHVGCIAHALILAHVVSMATFKGIPGVQAATVLSVIAGTSVVSRFVFSVLAEKLGGRLVLTISLIGQGAPVLILFFANEAWVFYLFAVMFGLCYGGEMVGFPIINKQLYGAKAPLSSIYSYQMVGASLGMALGGWLGGALFDMHGSYHRSLVASMAIGCLGIPMALALPRHKPATELAARRP
jgi:MFS family permease